MNVWFRRVGPVAAILLVVAVIVLQQFHRHFADQTLAKPDLAKSVGEGVSDPGIGTLTLESKFAVKMLHFERRDLTAEEIAEQSSAAMKELDDLAETRADRLRVALVAGELLGKNKASERLKVLDAELREGSNLKADIFWFLKLYGPEGRAAVTDEAAAALIARHGWFAELALSMGSGDADRARLAAVGGGGRVATVMMIEGLIVLGMGLLSILLFVGVIMSFRDPAWQSELETTELPGGVYLEMFIMFLTVFTVLLGLQIVTLWFTGPASIAGLAIGELLLWSIPICFIWPRIRGVDPEEFRTDLGWTMGGGWWTEIRAGCIGYFASLPLVVLVAWLTRVFLAENEGELAGGYSPFQNPLGNSWIPVVLSTLSAVIWAPIVEETLFRGAFYRSLRTRLGPWLAIPISAAVFGAIHPYSTEGLVSVAVGGVIFGLLREWRGSLIAPITAHFLHNGTISLFMILNIVAVD